MKYINVIYTRDSIGGEDDNRADTSFRVGDSTTYGELFSLPVSAGFLPVPLSSDSVWALERGGVSLISSLEFTCAELAKPSKATIASMTAAGMRWGDTERLHYRFYPALLDYAERIFALNGGSKYMMWHDGFLDEYNVCSVPPGIEREWLLKYDFHPKM
ncbi:MAG: hypothetical protein LBO63_05085 [Oscillospiraceae bacterium]|jgi:hypothetical protein|nr:hypothetical protein [Oscillospiraceae bacterium]